MRVPPFYHVVNWMHGLGLFVSGMIIGSAIFMSVYQHNFNLLKIENNELRREANRLRDDNDALNKYKNKVTIIKSVVVRLDPDPEEEIDRVAENVLIEKVEDDLKIVRGKPIAKMASDAQTYWRLVDGKNYIGIQDKDYRVHVKMMAIVYSELQVTIAAEQILRN